MAKTKNDATVGTTYDQAIYNDDNCAEKGNYWTRPGWAEPICGIPNTGNPCRLQYLDGSEYTPSLDDARATDWVFVPDAVK